VHGGLYVAHWPDIAQACARPYMYLKMEVKKAIWFTKLDIKYKKVKDHLTIESCSQMVSLKSINYVT